MRKIGGMPWTLNRFMGIILAVIGIIFIIYLSVQLFGAWNKGQESRNAEKLLDQIVSKIESVDEQGNFVVQGVDKWYLFAWSKTEKIGKPKKCLFDSCLCVCPSREGSYCQDGGFCESLDYEEVELFMYTVVEDKEKTFFAEDVIKDRRIIENYENYRGRTTADAFYKNMFNYNEVIHFKYDLLSECAFLDSQLRDVLVKKEGGRLTVFVLLNLDLDHYLSDENIPAGEWKMRAACEK